MLSVVPPPLEWVLHEDKGFILSSPVSPAPGTEECLARSRHSVNTGKGMSESETKPKEHSQVPSPPRRAPGTQALGSAHSSAPLRGRPCLPSSWLIVCLGIEFWLKKSFSLRLENVFSCSLAMSLLLRPLILLHFLSLYVTYFFL